MNFAVIQFLGPRIQFLGTSFLEVVSRLERDLRDQVAEVEGGRRPRLVVFPVPVARRGQGRSGRRRQGLLRRRRRPLEVPAANFIVQSQKSKVRYGTYAR